MEPLTLDIVFKLLGTQNIPGSPKELEILSIRITEMVNSGSGIIDKSSSTSGTILCARASSIEIIVLKLNLVPK
jgi:hypothetical protein